MRRCLCDDNSAEIQKTNRGYASARVADYTQLRTVTVVVHAMYSNYRRADITYLMATLNRNMSNRDVDHRANLKSTSLGILRRRHLFRGSNLKARSWRAYLRRARDTFFRFELGRIIRPVPLTIDIASGRDTITSRSIKPWGYKNRRTLHIWLVKGTGGVLGMASFPWETNLQHDGVIVDYRTIHPRFNHAPYGLNKTLVHEVGHWLGLLHTFQTTDSALQPVDLNGNDTLDPSESTGDFVLDTPAIGSATTGNPFQTRSFPLDVDSRVAQFNNYMDYSDDDVYTMFTLDQRKRMHYFFHTYRT